MYFVQFIEEMKEILSVVISTVKTSIFIQWMNFSISLLTMYEIHLLYTIYTCIRYIHVYLHCIDNVLYNYQLLIRSTSDYMDLVRYWLPESVGRGQPTSDKAHTVLSRLHQKSMTALLNDQKFYTTFHNIFNTFNK